MREKNIFIIKIIQNRLGIKIKMNAMICVYHCFEVGIDWRPPKRYHANHTVLPGKKASTMIVSYKVVMRMLQEVHKIPTGAKFCFPHLKSKNNEKNECKDS